MTLISAGWKNRVVQFIRVDSHDCYTSVYGPWPFNFYKVRSNKAKPQIFDFTEKNGEAKRFRSDLLKNWKRSPVRTKAPLDYAFTSLYGEVLQLRELLSYVRAGKLYHVPGVMSRVRLLVIGKPSGLLQVCAAYLDAPLIVYTSRNPTIGFPVPPSGAISLGAQSFPTKDEYSNPIDLDVWLSLTGMEINGETYTNRQIIREIGNTIGSHRDLDIETSVVFLMSTQSDEEVPMDNICRFSLMVGRLVVRLAEELISQLEQDKP